MPRPKTILFFLILFSLGCISAYAVEINCNNFVPSPSLTIPERNFQTGYCQYKSGNYKEAIRTMREVGRQMPLLLDYVTYIEAGSYKGLENFRQAEKRYRKIYFEFPSSSLRKDALASLADLYREQGKYDKAIDAYQRLITEDESQWSKAIYSNAIGEILLEQNLTGQAFQVYRDIWVNYPQSTFSVKVMEIANRNNLEFNPSNEERLRRADRLYELKSWNNAADEYSRLPASRDINFKIAKSYYNTGRLESAITAFGKLNDPESLYWKGRSYEKIGRFKQARETYLSVNKLYPGSEFAPMGLYRAGKLEQRNLRTSNAERFYKQLIVNYPAYEKTPDAAFNLGWIYYSKGRYAEALDIFSTYSYPEDSFDVHSFTYWKAKTLERMGRRADAYNIYKSLAFSDRFTYHAFLARVKIDHMPRVQSSRPGSYLVLKNPNYEKASLFVKMGIYEYAKIEAAALENSAKSDEQLIAVSQLYNRMGDIYKSVNLLEKIDTHAALVYKYPQPFSEEVYKFSNKYDLDVLLVYSLIREESRYNKDAVSSSNARGLMQLIRGTASDSAREVGIYPYNFNKLFEPEVNVELGSFYLRKVLDRYNGEIPLGLASYNAGPNRVAEWVDTIGYYKFDEFIEKIPITETRNYVKRILRSYGAYNALYRN